MNDEEIKKKARNKAGISFRKPHTVFTDAINNFLMEKAIVLARADTAEHYMTEIDFYINQNAELIRKIKISRREAFVAQFEADASKVRLAALNEVLEWLEKECKSNNYETETRNPYGERPTYISENASWAIRELKDNFIEKFKVGKGGLSV